MPTQKFKPASLKDWKPPTEFTVFTGTAMEGQAARKIDLSQKPATDKKAGAPKPK